MNALELAREYFPLFSDDHLGRILISCTAFPSTTDVEFLRRQLDDIQQRSGGHFCRAMEIACSDFDAAMETRVTNDLSTHQINRLREESRRNYNERDRIGEALRRAEQELVCNPELYAKMECIFNFNGLTYTLWPKNMETHFTGYAEIGDGVYFTQGKFTTDDLESMRAFIEKSKFKSVTVDPIHLEVLEMGKQLGL